MKKLIITGTASFLLAAFAQAQAPSGLDSVIVEKYYVSNLNDKSVDGTGGVLPLNSITYRVYVDMKPGYKFEAAYGVDVQPTGTVSPGDHELRIQTSTTFFNNEDRGATTPAFSKINAEGNTVMLDSWFSSGAACNGNFGILKTEDNGTANAVNADGVLQNNNALSGIPLTTQDGFITGTPEAVTFVGMASPGSSGIADISLFDDGTANGSLLSTYNASWASLSGSTGPTATNRVLIGQITTDGSFSFMLNLQIGTPTAGVAENWVANSPVGNEGTHPSLTYSYTPMLAGINSYQNGDASFSVYPNPTLDAITIDVNKTTQSANNTYTVYGVDGKVVVTKNLGMISNRYQERIDLSTVAPGLYFVELSLDGVRSTKKVVKQ
ncbi:MAG: T9SS type A sorting domain-containing protein [Bacteroidia bacterium]